MNDKNIKKEATGEKIKIDKVNNKQNNDSFTYKVEKAGYKLANRLHKFGVLSIITFILYNFYVFGREYNSHWRARRVIHLIYKLIT